MVIDKVVYATVVSFSLNLLRLNVMQSLHKLLLCSGEVEYDGHGHTCEVLLQLDSTLSPERAVTSDVISAVTTLAHCPPSSAQTGSRLISL